MSKRVRIALLITGAVVALLSAALLIFTLVPYGGAMLERATVAPTVLAAP